MIYTRTRFPGPLWLTCLVLLGICLILLTACNNTGTSSTASQHATPRPALTSTPFQAPITYVALGASDAVGVGSNLPATQGYVPLITARLPKGSHTLNLGISGIRLHQALSEELPLALNTSPQLITIWLVANDFVDGVSYTSYISDLNTLLTRLRAKNSARIIMANLPDLTRLPSFGHDTPAQKTRILQNIKSWNQGIARVAASHGVAIVNLFQDGSEITAHPNYISGDGFHPSSQGYARLAQLFWQVIEAKTA